MPELASFDLSSADHRLQQVRLVALTDVDTVLSLAAQLYGPQKGVGEDQVDWYREAFMRFGATVALQFVRDVRWERGSGAAGGLGAAVQALGADVVSGANFIMVMQGIRESMAEADLVLTGEGSFDAQSREGKGTGAILEAARQAGKRAAVVAARVDPAVAGKRGSFVGAWAAAAPGEWATRASIREATRQAVLAALPRARATRSSSPASAPAPSTRAAPARRPQG